MHLCKFIPMSPHSLIQCTFGIVSSARISPLGSSCAVMWMSRKGSFLCGQVQSTHGEKREAHILTPTESERTLYPFLCEDWRVQRALTSLPCTPKFLPCKVAEPLDSSKSCCLLSAARFYFLVPECVLWARSFLFCYGNIIHLEVIHVEDTQNPH